ncbi:MAG: FtsX-like permease family protein [Acidobacteria bacterium]|nr:FtsX-like permease family protein [Acidobacteriota bacterium]
MTAGRRALAFAWRSLVRQPARATLGILGVAAVGALLFDMLLLSEGLVISMRGLLDRLDYDVRVTATDALPGTGPTIDGATGVAAAAAALPSVRSVTTLRIADAAFERGGLSTRGSLQGLGGTSTRRPWTLLRGQDVGGAGELVINEAGARQLGLGPGSSVTVRASCSDQREAAPPVAFRVAGVVAFPFDSPELVTAATTANSLAEACAGLGAEAADFLLVASKGDPTATVADIAALPFALRAFTNEQVIGRLEEGGFTYFRQISAVLTTVTVSFALLLITVLLTVSVNQRLGEIAALRALGFTRARASADIFAESALIVGLGGLLSLPLGVLLAEGLDRILKRMPGIPEQLHFFVFEPQALAVHGALLAATAVLAALYPMWIVARLPIAATLRNEVIS